MELKHMFTIGLIDDNDSELDDICATLHVTWEKNEEINAEFRNKNYRLKNRTDLRDSLESELLQDIETNVIQGLIVDYKLDSLHKVISGKEIVHFIEEGVPAFPVVILTNAPEPGKREDVIDPDKVYPKYDFLAVDEKTSNEMCFKIFLNAKNYYNQRLDLETKLNTALDELLSRPDEVNDVDLLVKISEIENKLSKYKPMSRSQVDSASDLAELKDIISRIVSLEDQLGIAQQKS